MHTYMYILYTICIHFTVLRTYVFCMHAVHCYCNFFYVADFVCVCLCVCMYVHVCVCLLVQPDTEEEVEEEDPDNEFMRKMKALMEQGFDESEEPTPTPSPTPPPTPPVS